MNGASSGQMCVICVWKTQHFSAVIENSFALAEVRLVDFGICNDKMQMNTKQVHCVNRAQHFDWIYITHIALAKIFISIKIYLEDEMARQIVKYSHEKQRREAKKKRTSNDNIIGCDGMNQCDYESRHTRTIWLSKCDVFFFHHMQIHLVRLLLLL